MIEGVIADVEPQRSSIERAIVERATAGDEIAFARIVAAFHEDLARIAYFVTGDRDVAEEAEQAAWTIAYRRLKDLRDPDRLRPWLMSIAANEARHIARRPRRRAVRQSARSRRRRRVRELSVADRGRSGDVDHAAMIDLANSLARLDERDRTIVGLGVIGGLASRAECARAG